MKEETLSNVMLIETQLNHSLTLQVQHAQDQGSGEDLLDSSPGSLTTSCVTLGKHLTSLIFSTGIYKNENRTTAFLKSLCELNEPIYGHMERLTHSNCHSCL